MYWSHPYLQIQNQNTKKTQKNHKNYKTQKNIKIIKSKNYNKRTLREMSCMLLKNKKPKTKSITCKYCDQELTHFCSDDIMYNSTQDINVCSVEPDFPLVKYVEASQFKITPKITKPSSTNFCNSISATLSSENFSNQEESEPKGKYLSEIQVNGISRAGPKDYSQDLQPLINSKLTKVIPSVKNKNYS